MRHCTINKNNEIAAYAYHLFFFFIHILLRIVFNRVPEMNISFIEML